MFSLDRRWRWVEADAVFSSDLPQEEVQSKLDEVNKKIREVKRSYPDCTAAKGAAIWLVPTHKGIDEWQPIAVRHLPNVQWNATSDL